MTPQTNLLTGEKVYLGAQTKEHQKQIVEWENDIEFFRLLNFGHFRSGTIEQANEDYENSPKNDRKISFGIFTIEDNKLIGFCELMGVNWQAQNSWVAIAIGEKDYWGKGYGTDAMRILLCYAFMEVNLHRVVLGVFDYNKRAIKSYEKVGFKTEGHHKDALWRDGQFYDSYTMAILRPEWEAQQK